MRSDIRPGKFFQTICKKASPPLKYSRAYYQKLD